VTGHLLGAAGAIESIICSMALQQQEVPPTLNLTQSAEDCDLDYVPRVARPRQLNVVLNLNSGFGGKNSCLVIGRADEEHRRRGLDYTCAKPPSTNSSLPVT
jgi:3-oxoacyl-[acyl-carrier-protein] synthase II